MKQERLISYDGKIHCGTSLATRKQEWLSGIICDHDYIVFSYVIAGKGYFQYEGGNRITIKPGDLIIRFPGKPHKQLYSDGIYADKFIALPTEFAKIFADGRIISADNPVIHLGLYSWIIEKYDGLFKMLTTARQDTFLPFLAECFNFVINLLTPVIQQRPHYEQILKAATLLDKDYSCTIPIPRIAAAVNLSYATFRRLFPLYYGVSPVDFRLNLRMKKIQEELLSRDTPLKHIAAKYGFADIHTFNRQFRKLVGDTPNNYRQGHRHI